MELSYVLTPLITWLAAGILKFIINSIKAGRLAFDLIGYGGLPSNHTAIVCSITALIAFKEGINNPDFGIAVTLSFIVMLDAYNLRRHVGNHAKMINKLASTSGHNKILRERIGHSRTEIFAGALAGIGVAATIKLIFG